MKKLKLNQNRRFIEFDYEFKDTSVVPFKYFQPNTIQIKKALEIKDDDIKTQLSYTIEVLKQCLEGQRKDELIKEQEDSNIFEFKDILDEQLGKSSRRK